jgi:hypothetical protein
VIVGVRLKFGDDGDTDVYVTDGGDVSITIAFWLAKLDAPAVNGSVKSALLLA